MKHTIEWNLSWWLWGCLLFIQNQRVHEFYVSHITSQLIIKSTHACTASGKAAKKAWWGPKGHRQGWQWRSKHRRKDSYFTYINKVLKQVHPITGSLGSPSWWTWPLRVCRCQDGPAAWAPCMYVEIGWPSFLLSLFLSPLAITLQPLLAFLAVFPDAVRACLFFSFPASEQMSSLIDFKKSVRNLDYLTIYVFNTTQSCLECVGHHKRCLMHNG